ncbi:MAG TPA: DUF3108 domain-containing protein [Terriglobales bacterium]|nr:DUF3108 domain-containing protein [Terriglobales bacterium]
MRKAIILSLLSVLFWSALSSGQLLITNPNWKNGEKFSYEVRFRDTLIGSMNYLITDTLFDKIKVYQIKVTTDVGLRGQNTADTVFLLVRQQNLKPLYSNRTLITPQLSVKFKAQYLTDRVKVSMVSTQGAKETEMSFPEDGYDNDEMTLILRALNLRPGAEYTFKDVSPMSLTNYAVEVSVLQPEKVRTRLGVFLCNKVKMKVAGKEADIWYQKNKPNHMVKYADLQSGTTMLLKALK